MLLPPGPVIRLLFQSFSRWADPHQLADSAHSLQYLRVPMETAVSCESPVIILMATPEPMSVATASLTPDLGGSMMPTRPRKVRFPSWGPEAKASTAGRAEVSAGLLGLVLVLLGPLYL